MSKNLKRLVDNTPKLLLTYNPEQGGNATNSKAKRSAKQLSEREKKILSLQKFTSSASPNFVRHSALTKLADLERDMSLHEKRNLVHSHWIQKILWEGVDGVYRSKELRNALKDPRGRFKRLKKRARKIAHSLSDLRRPQRKKQRQRLQIIVNRLCNLITTGGLSDGEKSLFIREEIRKLTVLQEEVKKEKTLFASRLELLIEKIHHEVHESLKQLGHHVSDDS